MIWEAHGVMNDRLKIKWGTSSWRANENHYYAGNGYRYKPGAVNFAYNMIDKNGLGSIGRT